jgi:hypothetical protein
VLILLHCYQCQREQACNCAYSIPLVNRVCSSSPLHVPYFGLIELNIYRTTVAVKVVERSSIANLQTVKGERKVEFPYIHRNAALFVDEANPVCSRIEQAEVLRSHSKEIRESYGFMIKIWIGEYTIGNMGTTVLYSTMRVLG